MDSSNANIFVVEDNSAEIGMDMVQITEKMQKMETELLAMKSVMNRIESSAFQLGWQMGLKFAKMEKEMEKMKMETQSLAMTEASMVAGQMGVKYGKMEKELEELRGQIYKNNKMDLANCASDLVFAENELLVTSHGDGWKCARAILPVPKFDQNAKEAYIAFYFEGHIKQTSTFMFVSSGGVGMGFCSRQFPLEGDRIGNQRKSIGLISKRGMRISGEFINFQEVDDEHFKAGDKIGLGLIYEPKKVSVKCFAICNRTFLGFTKLSAKFFDVPIFPVVGLRNVFNSVHLNFGQEEWDFDPCQLIQ